MDNEAIIDRPGKKYKRQRFMSCPSINEHISTSALITPVPRTHRQSQIEEFTCFHSDYSKLKSSNSDSGSNNFPQSSEIGVRSFSSWKPRRNSTTFDNEVLQTVACRATFVLNEDRVLDEMNVDTKRVIESKSGCGTYYRDRVGAQNPFKSDLYLRVLYLIGSAGAGEEVHNSSIQDQFLSEEQIRENQLKEQLYGVERLRQEMASGDSSQSRSGTVTPAEFIYQTIPNIIKRNSFSNFKVDPDPPPIFVAESNLDPIKVSVDDAMDHHHVDSFNITRNKSSHKLTGREKCMLAPLTF